MSPESLAESSLIRVKIIYYGVIVVKGCDDSKRLYFHCISTKASLSWIRKIPPFTVVLLSPHRDAATRMEDMERMQLYFRGHTDGFSYLKKIGAI